jgi:hypothetical protein
MQKAIFLCALLTATSSLFAADPFVGTWKLDPGQSTLTSGTVPKELTLLIEDKGENVEVAANGTYPDGSPISIKYTVPHQGGTGDAHEGPFDGISVKMISDDVREVTYLRGGKQVASRHAVVSKDGKTLRITLKGIDIRGKPVSGVEFFQKQ